MTVDVGQETRRVELTPEMVLEDYHRYKKQRIRGGSLASSNWPTVLAHPCEAYGVYMRTVPPEKRRPMNDSLGMRFSEGDDQERAVKRDLLEMGYDVSGEQGQMVWVSRQISGRKDCKIRKPGIGLGVEVEIKSCSPYLYAAIRAGRDGVDDIKNHKFFFVQKWYRQVCLYMVLKEIDRYWMILKDKSGGDWKIVDFHRGDEETRIGFEMADKADRINKLIQIGKMPDASLKVTDPELCCDCEFFSVCLPELNFGMAAKILTEDLAAEMQAKLDRHATLKPFSKEFEELDEELKDEIKSLTVDGAEDVVIGDWLAHVKIINVKAVPAKTLDAKPASTRKQISFTKVEQVSVSG